MNSPDTFRLAHPGLFQVDPADLAGLAGYLSRRGVLAPDETPRTLSRAGDGNMNCTVRLTTDHRNLIVKQARPWVEKYPQFAAPWDRALREIEFYEITARIPRVAAALPRLLHTDREARLLVLEDLGAGGDFSTIYAGTPFPPEALDALVDVLADLHAAFPDAATRPSLPNRELRALNHAHIFDIPLQSRNGLDLDAICPGLQSAADDLRRDAGYVRDVARLGHEVYLADGPCLLHGDFFPGSFIRTPAGPRLIDPEFCFFGRPEIDLSVLLAHLSLAGQPGALRHRARRRYRPPAGFSDDLLLRLVGVEIMRRLIGYAQLPLRAGRPERVALLELSRELVLRPHPSWLEPPACP